MSGFYVYGEIIFQLIRHFQRNFPRNLQYSKLKVTKKNSKIQKFENSGHVRRRFRVTAIR